MNENFVLGVDSNFSITILEAFLFFFFFFLLFALNGTKKEEVFNLASRLQSMAEPREILIDEHTARFLTPHFETQKQLVDVKGMGPQIAYAVC